MTSDSSSEDSDEEDDIDDTRLMLEIRKKFQKIDAAARKRFKSESRPAKASPNLPLETSDMASNESSMHSSLDERLRAEFQLDSTSDGSPPTKKRRSGLVTEVHIISVSIWITYNFTIFRK